MAISFSFYEKKIFNTTTVCFSFTYCFYAFPFGGDIVYKTDVGEKYIVKKSTVEKISENIWNSYLRISSEITSLEQLIKEREEVWEKRLKRI